ncbi:MAG: thymidylate kinase [Planctomycetales bacterium]|nr:thymidylate kinase [Planctomycetales bacterium]
MALLVDIEGIDGSGKGTQAQRLVERLQQHGCRTSLLSFPRYTATRFGRAVGEFLNGRFGRLDEVHPFLVSLLFAGDRFESRDVLQEALQSNDVVVLDRYVPSNVAHQASKLEGAEREELTQAILDIEFRIYELPRPDVVVLLDLSPDVAQQLIAKKAARSYTDRRADIQEADGAYLGRCREVYMRLANTEPDWLLISCCDGPRLRTVDEIADHMWSIIRPRLPVRPE